MKFENLRTLTRSFSVLTIFVLLSASMAIVPVYAAPGDVTRVSVSSSGEQADAMSYSGQISADGRFVVFDSEAGNLVVGDTNGLGDVFLYDRQLGTTTRVSVDASGAQVNGGGGPSISADGRFVAFESGATNLVVGDTNNLPDIFVKDTQTGAVTRSSVSSSGEQANDHASDASISGDGRYVVFVSGANNLVLNDVNEVQDVFVHDRQTGVTARVSVDANAISFDASISLDGHYVVFSSNATNLVSGDTNGKTDVFVYAVQTGVVTRASVSSSGVQGDQASNEPSISGDGRYVTFSSPSNNFITEDTLGFTYMYVHDMQTGSTTMASIYNGTAMFGRSDSSVISANGRYIAFSFDDRGDGLPTRRIYIHDRVEGVTISAVSGSGSEGTNNPILPSISSDGRFLGFASMSNILVSGDTNGFRDIFVKEIGYPPSSNPTVISITHVSSTEQAINFQVKFSESVNGVDASDFALTIGEGISGATVTGVSGVGSEFNVTVDVGAGDGTIRLDVVDNDSIQDVPLNPLGGVGAGNGNFTTGDVVVVDKSVPAVTSITRLDANPSVQSSVRFAVNFSEQVNGVDASDFSLSTTGWLTNISITEIIGSGSAYTVTANTGVGDGTLRLDLIDNHSITDASSKTLNGNFTSGEVYTLERNMPVINSIVRMDANSSSAQSVNFRLTFSEPVTGVDTSDFNITANGIVGASIIAVNGAGNSYAITIGTGTNNGSLRLDLIDNDSILDSANNPLGGTGSGNGNLIGESYDINKTTLVYSTTTFRSSGSNDGWVLELNENSNVGGSINATAPILNVGDNAQDAQYRTILHFPTQGLPDNAVVTRVILTIKRQNIVGTNPFTTHQNIQIDIVTGNFGFDSYLGSYGLQPLDFQAPSTLNAVGTIQNNPVGDVYWSLLNGDANRLINLRGITQLRLYFQLDDNDDLGDDFISFFSGDADRLLNRPHLQIEYYVPR